MRVHVDVARAPETAGYFLRDVAAGLFDGTSFYRIATDANQDDDQPVSIEVIQGGLPQPEVAPASSLRHESTAETGLRHERGTISLARFAPGAVYHSFFICGRDEPSLDPGGAPARAAAPFARPPRPGLSPLSLQAAGFARPPTFGGTTRLAVPHRPLDAMYRRPGHPLEEWP